MYMTKRKPASKKHGGNDTNVWSVIITLAAIVAAVAAIVAVLLIQFSKQNVEEPVIELVVEEVVEEEVVEEEVFDADHVAFEDFTVGDLYTFNEFEALEATAFIPEAFGELATVDLDDQVLLQENENSFLAVITSLPGADRGGYWGDLGSLLRENTLDELCDALDPEAGVSSWVTSCEIVESSVENRYAWLKGTYQAFRDAPQEFSNVYIFEHPGDDKVALVISDIELQDQNNELDAADSLIRVWTRTIVDSLSFYSPEVVAETVE